MNTPPPDESDADNPDAAFHAERTRANFEMPTTLGCTPSETSTDEATIQQVRTLLDPSDKPDSIGRIQEYEILSLQGRGAMGFVFKAHHPALHRVVAIKIMVSELSATPGARERFIRESQSAASINHNNVVTVHAVGSHRGLPFLVMEFVNGETLQDLIHKSGKLSVEDTLRIAHQIAAGLSAAHQCGIVHRDVKPGNILIENGVRRVKVADFGLARVALESSGLTSHGQTVGTPGYMSPEQVEGLKVDFRADLFSLGCVTYAMLTGHSPFRAGNTLAVLQAVAKQPHVPLREADASIPPQVAEFVEKLLKKNPDVRLSSATEAVNELEELIRTVGTPSRIVETTRKAEIASAADRATQKTRLGWGVAIAAVTILTTVLAVRNIPNTAVPSASTETGPNAGHPETGTNTVNTNDSPRILSPNVVVGNQPDADFRSVQRALDRRPAPKLIRVASGADLNESVNISGPEFDGLEMVWEGSGALSAPNGKPVVRVHNAAKVTLRGIRIAAQSQQHGLMVEGRCPGLMITDCSITQPDRAPAAAVFFSKATGLSAETPMILRRTRIAGSDLPIALIGDTETPVEHWLAEECLILGIPGEKGTAIVTEGPCSDIRLHRNRLSNYGVGLSMGPIHDRLEITGNTLHEMKHFFSTRDTIDSACHFEVADNLLFHVGLDKIGPQLQTVSMEHFHDNLHVGSKPADWPGTRDANVDFVTTDQASADFLRPAHAAAVTVSETGTKPVRYAGALPPAEAADE